MVTTFDTHVGNIRTEILDILKAVPASGGGNYFLAADVQEGYRRTIDTYPSCYLMLDTVNASPKTLHKHDYRLNFVIVTAVKEDNPYDAYQENLYLMAYLMDSFHGRNYSWANRDLDTQCNMVGITSVDLTYDKIARAYTGGYIEAKLEIILIT